MDNPHALRAPKEEAFSLAGLVECRPHRVISQTLYRSGGDSAVVFAFDAKEGISREILDEDALYWLLEGEIVMRSGDGRHDMRGGECFVVPARTPHSVDVVSQSKLLIITIGPLHAGGNEHE